jgi:single-strand DNA-binding protein
MPAVNKVILLGNVGQDPEVRHMPNGDAVCNLSLATNRKWKDKNGDVQEEVEWHRLTFFARQAEIVGEYVDKGDPLYVEGRLKTRKYTDKDGAEKYTTEIIVDQLQLLGSGGGGGQQQRGRGEDRSTRGSERGGRSGGGRESAPPRQRNGNGNGSSQARQQSGTGFDSMDDDIPF